MKVFPRHTYLLSLICLLSIPIIAQTDYQKATTIANQAKTTKDYPKAQQYYQIALDEALKNGDSILAAKALMNMSDCQMNLGQLDEVIDTYRQCEMLAQNGNDTLWASAIIAQATIKEIQGDKDASIETVRPILRKPQVPAKERIAAYLITGDGLVDLGFPDSAKTYLDTALKLTAFVSDSQAITGVHQTLGNMYFSQNEYENGLTHFLKALDFYPSSLSRSGKPNIYNNIGQLYHYMGQADEAKEYSLSGMRLAKEVGSSIALYQGKHIYGQSLVASGQIAKGIATLDSVRQYYLDRSRWHYVHRIDLDLVDAYLKMGETDLAKEYLNHAEEIEPEVQGIRHQMRKHLAWFDLYLLQGLSDRAEKEILQAKAFTKNLRNPRSMKAILEREIALLGKQGNYMEAFDRSKELKALEDEISSLATTRVVNEIQSKYNKAENERKILALSLENRIKTETIQRERNRLWTSIVFSILALASVLIILIQVRKIKKQKDVIATALEERETLLREIHHRVKNNLQVISSLLFLQAETVKDEKALAALQEGRNRVKSMSLIHQNLYQEDNLIGVNTTTYFEKLIGGLFASYNVDRELIKVDIEVESMIIDIDSLVPLALIVNELMSNSLKHAFDSNQLGQIRFVFKRAGDKIHLLQSDNGRGFEGAWAARKSDSFGFQLIEILSKKLDAQFEVDGRHGFHFSLTCSIPENG